MSDGLCGAGLNGAAQGFPALYCERDTGFSLFMISRLPSASEMAAMCSNSNCQTVISAIRANVPKDCQVSYWDKIMLYSQVLDPIKATCANAPKTPPATAPPATAAPATAAPPPPPAPTTPAPTPSAAIATTAPVTTTPVSTTASPTPTDGPVTPNSASGSTDMMQNTSSPTTSVGGANSTSVTSTPSSSASGSSTITTNAKSSDGGVNVSLVVGIVAGVVFIIAFIAFIAFRAGKKRNAVSKTPDVEYAVYGIDGEQGTNGTYATDRSGSAAGQTSTNPRGRGGVEGITFHTKSRGSHSGTPAAAGGPGAIGLWGHPAIQSARIPLEGILFGEVLSRGAFGEVLVGSYDGQTVAIKRLLSERRKNMQEIEAFLEEVKLVTTLHHPRIVSFIGVAWDSLSDLCLVAEFMDGGDLRSLLSQYDSTNHPTGFNTDKVKMAMHVAHALSYLHGLSPSVVHRDLKSKNVLLTKGLDAKLTDFGVSRQHADSTMTAGVGSSLWMAPEVMVGERYSEKADIFSFGVVLSELDTQVLPYSHAFEPGTDRKLPEMAILQMVSMGRISVAFSEGADAEIVDLARTCVALEPADRPTANEVLRQFHHIWRNYGGNASWKRTY